MLLTEGSKRCRSPRHHLTPSQRILATVTLLPHYLRQRSAKLPSSITLFINQMADTSMDNTEHVNAHSIISIAWANDAGYLLATAGSVNIPLCFPALYFHTSCFPRDNQPPIPLCLDTVNPKNWISQVPHPVLLIIMQHLLPKKKKRSPPTCACSLCTDTLWIMHLVRICSL